MNYIKQLQQRVAGLEARADNTRDAIQDFRIYLNSPKFTGLDTDGTRKDWIATSDVYYLLDGIRNALNGTA